MHNEESDGTEPTTTTLVAIGLAAVVGLVAAIIVDAALVATIGLAAVLGLAIGIWAGKAPR
jgi:hypothetical protein